MRQSLKHVSNCRERKAPSSPSISTIMTLIEATRCYLGYPPGVGKLGWGGEVLKVPENRLLQPTPLTPTLVLPRLGEGDKKAQSERRCHQRQSIVL